MVHKVKKLIVIGLLFSCLYGGFPVHGAELEQPSGRVAGDGDRLVWSSIINGNSEIILFDMQTNMEVRMTNHPATQTNPDISESYVVWQDDRNSADGPIRNYDIYLYDLVSKKGKKLSQASGSHEEPKIDGNYVVWHNTSGGKSNVVVYNLSTNTEETITDNTNAFGVQLDGQIVTWMQYNSPYFDIYAYNLSTKQQVRLTYGEGDHKDPYISGDTIVWHDYRNADRDIYAYSLSATKEQAVAKEPGVDRILGFANGTLVYENKTDQQLYAYNLDTTAVEKLHYSSSTGNIIVLGEAILSVSVSGVASSNIQSSSSGGVGTNPPSGNTGEAASSEENKDTKQVTITSADGTHVEHRWKVTEIQPVTAVELVFEGSAFTVESETERSAEVNVRLGPFNTIIDSRLAVYGLKEGKWNFIGGGFSSNERNITVSLSEYNTFALARPSTSFSDMTNHWANNEVDVLYAHNIVRGYNGNQFIPNKSITRAEFVKMLMSLYRDSSLTGTKKLPYLDVPTTHWAYSSISMANELNWITGYGEQFKPNQYITREEIVTILARFIQADLSSNMIEAYKDYKQLHDWSSSAFNMFIQSGLIKGNNGYLAPQSKATRAEAAVFLLRVLQHQER